MSNRTIIILSAIIITIFGLGFGLMKAFLKMPAGLKMKDIKVLTELPSEIERTNPVPEVHTWNSNGRTFYYFNWGFKPTSGYDLNLLSVKGDKLIIQASAPSPSSINSQVITYPYLLLSLPEGDYDFEVVDEHNRPLQNIFQPLNPPLELSLFVPSGSGGISRRKVLRDPYLNTEGKSTVEIALEALFAQDEMMEYLVHDVTFDGISFSPSRKECFIVLSHGYQTLTQPEKKLLNQLMIKTIQAVVPLDPEDIKITTAP